MLNCQSDKNKKPLADYSNSSKVYIKKAKYVGNLLALSLICFQAVKFEPYHDSALARFLLKRALRVS